MIGIDPLAHEPVERCQIGGEAGKLRSNFPALLDTSKNRWQSELIADSVQLGARGIGDGGTAGIFRQR